MNLAEIQAGLAVLCEEHAARARTPKSRDEWTARLTQAQSSDLSVLHSLLCTIKMQRSKARPGRILRSLSSPRDDFLFQSIAPSTSCNPLLVQRLASFQIFTSYKDV